MSDFFKKLGSNLNSLFNSVCSVISRPFTGFVGSVAKPLSQWIVSLAILGIVLIFLLGAVKKTKIGSQWL